MLTKDSINNLPKENHFRFRGIETTRLDTFIDAAFATTMLVISVANIPENFSELASLFVFKVWDLQGLYIFFSQY